MTSVEPVVGRVLHRLARSPRAAINWYRVVRIRSGPAAGCRVGLRYASNAYRDGEIELPVQQTIAGLVRPGGTFFDIGANVGFFSLVAGQAVDGQLRIVAFEPHPRIADALRANLRRNGLSAQVIEAAVGDSDGNVELMISKNPGGSTIEASKSYDARATRSVRTVTIDALVESGELPLPDLIKIDVEGAEPAAIRGMRRTLDRSRATVVFEIDAPDATMAEAQYSEVEALLLEMGYMCARLPASYADIDWVVLHAIATATPR